MKTSKTALAAAAFGVAAAIAPASAQEVKYNFSSELAHEAGVAADGRAEGNAAFVPNDVRASGETAQSNFGFGRTFGNSWTSIYNPNSLSSILGSRRAAKTPSSYRRERANSAYEQRRAYRDTRPEGSDAFY